MATKTFKTVFDELIKEEEIKRKDNDYLIAILAPQSASFLRKENTQLKIIITFL